jgi:hypothetical protein
MLISGTNFLICFYFYAKFCLWKRKEAQASQTARDQVLGGSRRSRTRRAAGSRKKSSRSIRRRRRRRAN